jgi:ubiquinone/menaquinone biosynthesis C-methylase UbiE
MHSSDAKFAGSIPELYERYLGALLFEPYAEDLLQRLNDVRAGTVIEVAAGTGVVTRVLRKGLPADVRLIATDLNEAMLRVAQSRGGVEGVQFQQADAQRLPFQDASAQAIACQFGMMFVPNKPAAFREAHRVLAPGGRYVFNLWDSLTHNEVSQIVMRAVAAQFPDNPPAFFERTPFGYFDAEVIRDDLRAGGFERIEIETVAKVTQAPSAEFVAIGMCQGTPLRGEIEERNPDGLAAVTAATSAALQSHFGAGPFENRMSAVVVSAWRT